MTAGESTTRVVSESGNDIGPGQRLREAREAAKLSLAEVASRMRLEPQVLELLESDHYDHLHGPTFVRGYLSGYARLLDLPERPILEAYERHDYRPPALVSELGRKPEVHVSDFPVRMVTYVIAGLLVVLVVLWWQSRQPATNAPETANVSAKPAQNSSHAAPLNAGTAEPAVPALVAPVPTQAAVPAEDAPETGAESGEQRQPAAQDPGAAAAETASLPAPSRKAAIAAESSAAAETAVETPVPAGSTVTTPTSGESPDPASVASEAVAPVASAQPQTGAADEAMPADANETATETPAAPAPRPAPLPGSDRLAIKLAKESWIEIYDRGGGRLYYGLAREGSEIMVEGAGPMRVLLGDVEGAAVDYNGKAFDLSPYQGRSVVRFRVGELSGDDSPAPEPPRPAPAEPLTQEHQPPAADPSNSVADAGMTLVTPTSAAGVVLERVVPAPATAPRTTALDSDQPDS